MLTLKEALKTSNGKINRYILRLGKSEEEAGKFEPWGALPDTFEEDFQGFLACLRLTRLADSIAERMKTQKGSIRAIRKEQRETAKALQKEKDKLQKALDKAAKKVEREAEKQKIKAEAKAAREALKAAKKGAPCTSISKPNEESSGSLGTTPPYLPTLGTAVPTTIIASLSSPSTPVQETPQHAAIILTEVKETPKRDLSMEEMLLTPQQLRKLVEEPAVFVPPFKLPMEG
jgi:hypothetical protein